jgi:hypothetical protein
MRNGEDGYFAAPPVIVPPLALPVGLGSELNGGKLQLSLGTLSPIGSQDEWLARQECVLRPAVQYQGASREDALAGLRERIALLIAKTSDELQRAELANYAAMWGDIERKLKSIQELGARGEKAVET